MIQTNKTPLVATLVALVVLVAACSDPPSSSPATGPTSTKQLPTSTTTAQPTTTTTSPSTTTTTTFTPRSFTIAATGDLLIHTAVAQQARTYGRGATYDFGPMFEPVHELLTQPDLSICHIETPLSSGNTAISGYPVFNAPLELARAAADAGYDTCSTASNHSLDKGFTGIAATLDQLDAAGLHHAGTARTQLESETPTIFEVAGTKVAHLAYTYGTNGFPIPTEQPWAINVIDPSTMRSDAANARARGAEFVIISVQWGNEYQREPTAQQRELAQALLASPDIDLIIGHHVHVVQPVEKVGKKYVAYGLGNFLSNQSASVGLAPGTQDGVIMNFEVHETEPGKFETIGASFTPTFVDRPGFQIQPVTQETNPASYQRTVDAITLLGFQPTD